MNRDGAQKSIWQENIDNYTSINTWSPGEIYDVLIVGAGVTGLTTALLLQEKGKKCIIAESHNVGFGTSGGTTAHLNTLLDVPYTTIASNFGEDGARLTAQASKEAIELIETLVKNHNIDCDLERKTGYLFSQTEKESDELQKILEANLRAGVPSEWTNAIPIPVPFNKAIQVEGQGQIHITRYLHGLAKAYELNGGVLLQQCRVTTINNDEYIQAETSLGTIKARKLVYATHVPPGITQFSFRCAPYRSYAIAFTLKASGKYPDGLAYDSKDPYHYYRTQTIDGQQYVIAGGNDHKTGENDNTAYIFTELEGYMQQYFDVDKVAFKWSSQYYNSTDGLPYIGHMPGHDNTYVATGYGGNGIIFGSLSGRIITDLITTGNSKYKDIFSPGRIKPIAGFANFVKENADVVSQFIGRRFTYEQISQLVELAHGDATIVKLEGQKIALYKNENGKLYALDPVCPHAGCIVNWNNAEKTWDCPCHGARYAPDGDLLTGPSRKNLQKIDLKS